MINFQGDNISLIVSEKHDMIIDNKKVKAIDLLGEKIKESSLLLTGNYIHNENVDLSDNWIKLLTWVIMDATIVDFSMKNPNSKKMTVQFHLSKDRKIKELSKLLTEMDLPFTLKEAKKSGVNKLTPSYIRIYSDTARKIFSLLDGIKEIPKDWSFFNEHQVNTFLDTLEVTDGHRYSNSIVWNTTSKNDTDIVQEMCLKNKIVFKHNGEVFNTSGFENAKPAFRNRICKDENLRRDHYIKITKEEYSDYAYCYKMPLGTLIVRNNGKVNFSGNCNFDRIEKLPEMEMFGGVVGKLNGSIYHLKRGEIYTINGLKILTMGGGKSIDKARRTEFISWWSQEAPNTAEYSNCLNNLEKHDNKVDLIITHDCSQRIYNLFDFAKYDNPTLLQGFLETLEETVDYQHWYFGHFHDDIEFDSKHTLLYNRVKEITKE